MTNNNLTQLIYELKTQLNIPYQSLSEEYKSRMSSDEHTKEYEMLIELLEKPEIQNQLVTTGSIRFKKKTVEKDKKSSKKYKDKNENNELVLTELPRTVQIYLTEDGYKAVLEAKSKLAGGKEDPNKKSKEDKGSFKSCKVSFLMNPPVSKENQKKIGDRDCTYVTLSFLSEKSSDDKIGGSLTSDDLSKSKVIFDQQNEQRWSIEKEFEVATEVDVPRIMGVGLDMHVVKGPSSTNPNGKLRIYGQKGINLKDILNDKIKYPLTDQDRDKIFSDIVKEIRIIHSYNVYHKDIKPENIMVFIDENGKYNAKLADFGLCNLLTNDDICGTPIYMPKKLLDLNNDIRAKKNQLGVIQSIIKSPDLYTNQFKGLTLNQIIEINKKEEEIKLKELAELKAQLTNDKFAAHDMWSLARVYQRIFSLEDNMASRESIFKSRVILHELVNKNYPILPSINDIYEITNTSYNLLQINDPKLIQNKIDEIINLASKYKIIGIIDAYIKDPSKIQLTSENLSGIVEYFLSELEPDTFYLDLIFSICRKNNQNSLLLDGIFDLYKNSEQVVEELRSHKISIFNGINKEFINDYITKSIDAKDHSRIKYITELIAPKFDLLSRENIFKLYEFYKQNSELVPFFLRNLIMSSADIISENKKHDLNFLKDVLIDINSLDSENNIKQQFISLILEIIRFPDNNINNIKPFIKDFPELMLSVFNQYLFESNNANYSNDKYKIINFIFDNCITFYKNNKIIDHNMIFEVYNKANESRLFRSNVIGFITNNISAFKDNITRLEERLLPVIQFVLDTQDPKLLKAVKDQMTSDNINLRKLVLTAVSKIEDPEHINNEVIGILLSKEDINGLDNIIKEKANNMGQKDIISEAKILLNNYLEMHQSSTISKIFFCCKPSDNSSYIENIIKQIDKNKFKNGKDITNALSRINLTEMDPDLQKITLYLCRKINISKNKYQEARNDSLPENISNFSPRNS